MDGFDRIYDLHQLLRNARRPLTIEQACRRMECSPATFKRVKKHMTDFLGAPIEYDRESATRVHVGLLRACGERP